MALRRLARLGGALAASTSSSPAPTSSARVAAAATRWMATWQANELRVGALVEKDGAIAEVTKYQYTQGKARQVGCVQVEYRDLRTGASSVEKLSPSDKITRAELVSEEYQYMYDAGDDALILSHPTTFEQLEVSGETFGAQRRFLADGAFVDVLSHDGEVVGVQLPDEIRATVVETDPRFKGESKDGGRLKPCTLDTGATTRVPTYVEAGDVVVVKGPRTGALGEFVRRVRES